MNKTQILDAIQEEHKILKHLFSKVKPEDLTFSPGEKMRNTDELLCYISNCAISTLNWYDIQLKNGDKENAFQKYSERAKAMEINEFPSTLDRQYKECKDVLDEYSDEDLLNIKVKRIAGSECPLGQAIVNSSLKYLTSYRMQLFLYLKQNGRPELNTYNCWAGIDPPPKKD